MENVVRELLRSFSSVSTSAYCCLSTSLSGTPSLISMTAMNQKSMAINGAAVCLCCSDSNASTSSPATTTEVAAPRVVRKRTRYRRLYPGEAKGITEEMRFVAMGLRNIKGKGVIDNALDSSDEKEQENPENNDVGIDGHEYSSHVDAGDGGETWRPSLEGFLKYFVDSKLVFNTVERIVNESSEVAYTYFRKTGLERSDCLSKDLEWFGQQGFEIPGPSTPGLSYSKYLEELSEISAPLFLCHFYNVYFSHVAGGQVIARRVAEMLLEGRELNFYSWDGDVPELLKDFREKINMLGEHWSRDEKNKCLREAAKSYRYLGQIVRLIIL